MFVFIFHKTSYLPDNIIFWLMMNKLLGVIVVQHVPDMQEYLVTGDPVIHAISFDFCYQPVPTHHHYPLSHCSIHTIQKEFFLSELSSKHCSSNEFFF